MRSKVADRIMANMPEDTKIFAEKYGDLLVLINETLKEKGYTQKYLADALGKSPSEINKWLGGDHNFTLKSLCKIEAELGITLIQIPSPKRTTEFDSHCVRCTYTLTVARNKELPKKNSNNWVAFNRKNLDLANVG